MKKPMQPLDCVVTFRDLVTACAVRLKTIDEALPWWTSRANAAFAEMTAGKAAAALLGFIRARLEARGEIQVEVTK